MQHVDQKKLDLSARRIKFGSLATVGGRISNAGSQLLITGLLARTLEPNTFGIWVVLYTIYSLVPSLDFGLGQSLRLKLANLNASGSQGVLEQQLFSSVLFMLIAWGLIFAGIIIVVLNLILVLNLNLKIALMFFSVICGISVALSLGTQVFYSYEEGFERGILDMIQAVILVVAIWGVSGSANLETIVYVFFGMTSLISMGSLVWFIKRRGWVIKIPQISDSIIALQYLGRSSLWFWLLSVFAVGILNTSPLFIASMTNLEQVGHFSILQRLFGMLVTVHLAWLAPFQSAYTRAIALKEWSWLRATWIRSSRLTAIWMATVTVALMFTYQNLVLLWTGKIFYEPALVAIFSIWVYVWTWINVNSVVLNGIGILKPQVIFLGIGFLIYVSLGIFLVPLLGVSGILVASLIGILPLSILNPIWIQNKIAGNV